MITTTARKALEHIGSAPPPLQLEDDPKVRASQRYRLRFEGELAARNAWGEERARAVSVVAAERFVIIDAKIARACDLLDDAGDFPPAESLTEKQRGTVIKHNAPHRALTADQVSAEVRQARIAEVLRQVAHHVGPLLTREGSKRVADAVADVIDHIPEPDIGEGDELLALWEAPTPAVALSRLLERVIRQRGDGAAPASIVALQRESELQGQLDNARAEAANLSDRFAEAVERGDAMRDGNVRLREEVAGLQTQLEEARAGNERVRSQNVALAAERDELQTKYRAAVAAVADNQALQEEKSSHAATKGQLAKARNALEAAEAKVAELQAKLEGAPAPE